VVHLYLHIVQLELGQTQIVVLQHVLLKQLAFLDLFFKMVDVHHVLLVFFAQEVLINHLLVLWDFIQQIVMVLLVVSLDITHLLLECQLVFYQQHADKAILLMQLAVGLVLKDMLALEAITQP
jgi:hypothetical protein